ncbi:DUF5615 family PIN-like protein [[Phormidium] sp. ETS-05]|uniref:DUF5615 family PIN-like protein n=1 Tax=[Phormidium] sp. ETS-05 TaxID=222819 RepID=UPI0018EF0DE9|nr:DUF5615 family PIN-like protein [[Phormidium] sp. ETS-05]
MKILIDMNLSPTWVQVFARYDIEAIHWSTVGDPRATDRAIMNWASANGYVVFTNDLDFGALLAALSAEAPSVIQVRNQDILPDQIETILIETLRRFESQLESGALITINLTRYRVRILPLTPRLREELP